LRFIGQKSIAQRLCGSLQVDISKTKTLLNWVPPCSVNQALEETAQAYLSKH